MFSIFHGLFTLFALGVDSYNKTAQTQENKHQAKISGSKTYYGSRGNEYLVENDRQVYTKYNEVGEEVIADIKTGVVYHNITKEKKENKEKEYLARGKTVRFKMYNEHNQHYYGKYRQMYGLIDIATGIPVGEVRINNMRFYIRLDNAMVLRPTDDVEMRHLMGVWNVDEIIEIINERQKELVDTIQLDEYTKINEQLFYRNRCVYIDKDKNIHVFWHGEPNKYKELCIKDGLVYNKEEGRWM